MCLLRRYKPPYFLLSTIIRNAICAQMAGRLSFVDVYLAIVGVVSFLVGAIILRNQRERRRCRALEQEARRLRFSFMSVAKPFEGSAISELAACLQESSSIGVEQPMQGIISGRR